MQEDRAWQMWLQIYPDMIIPQPMSKNPAIQFIPFSEFLKSVTIKHVSQKPKEEILKDVENIRKMARPSRG